MTRGRDGAAATTFTVAGRRAVTEALRSGRARRVWVAAGSQGSSLREVLAAADEAHVPVERVEAPAVESLAAGLRHQGAVAEVSLAPALGERDLERHGWGERAVVLILDGVTDPHNLGACARTAEAAGAEALVIRHHRSAGITPAAVRSSAGALIHLRVATVANIARAVARLRAAGFWTVGLDGDALSSIDDVSPPAGRLGLVLGAEGGGLSRLVREACDELVSIPMRGSVGSLNVSVAAGVALFHPALARGRGG